jgi:hypothetical protein
VINLSSGSLNSDSTATTLNDADKVYIEQGGVFKEMTVGDFKESISAGSWDDASRFRTYGNGSDMLATVWSTDDVDKRNFNIHTISESGTATSDTEINLPTASATYVNHRITITSFDTDATYNNVIKGALGGDYTLADGEMVQVICSLNDSSYVWYVK